MIIPNNFKNIKNKTVSTQISDDMRVSFFMLDKISRARTIENLYAQESELKNKLAITRLVIKEYEELDEQATEERDNINVCSR